MSPFETVTAYNRKQLSAIKSAKRSLRVAPFCLVLYPEHGQKVDKSSRINDYGIPSVLSGACSPIENVDT